MNEEFSNEQNNLSNPNKELLSPTSPSPKQKVVSSTDSRLSHFQIIMMILYIVIILSASLVILLVPAVKTYLYGVMIEINNNMSIKMGFYLFLLGFTLTLIGFPILLYELALGYMINNFLLALTLDFLFKFFGVFCLFLFSRYVFKEKLEILFKDSIIFQTIKRAIQKNSWKALILIKILVIPHIFKNLGLGITDIKAYQFLTISFFNCIIFGSIWIYFGSEMKNLSEIFYSNERSFTYLMVKYCLLAISLIILVIMLFTAKLYFDEVKSEVSKEKAENQDNEKHETQADNKKNEEKLGNYGTIE